MCPHHSPRSSGGGARPCVVSWRPAWPRCAEAWRPNRRRERNLRRHIILGSWPALARLEKTGNAGSNIDSGASSCCAAPSDGSEVADAEDHLRRALAVAREQHARFWELPLPVSPASGATNASAPRRATSSRRSTAGSPKASTRPSCKTPKRSLTN